MDGTETDDRLSPDDAFAVLGNDVRVRILQALGDAAEPLAFSALYDQLPVDDTARFNYHLGELRGHFVRKTDAGYALDHPGRRVVEAILSGALTFTAAGDDLTLHGDGSADVVDDSVGP